VHTHCTCTPRIRPRTPLCTYTTNHGGSLPRLSVEMSRLQMMETAPSATKSFCQGESFYRLQDVWCVRLPRLQPIRSCSLSLSSSLRSAFGCVDSAPEVSVSPDAVQ
jgi:hypothetical protein